MHCSISSADFFQISFISDERHILYKKNIITTRVEVILLNVIAYGQGDTNKINRMNGMISKLLIVIWDMVSIVQLNHINKIITISMMTLSCFYVLYFATQVKSECHSNQFNNIKTDTDISANSYFERIAKSLCSPDPSKICYPEMFFFFDLRLELWIFERQWTNKARTEISFVLVSINFFSNKNFRTKNFRSTR